MGLGGEYTAAIAYSALTPLRYAIELNALTQS